MIDPLVGIFSLKVRRLFSQIGLNSLKLLTNFVQDLLEKGYVLFYGSISAKHLRKYLSHTCVQFNMLL